MKRFLGRIFSLLGIQPFTLIAIRHLPRFFSEAQTFKRLGGSISLRYPILSDYKELAGTMKGHYFHQDLFVAKQIFHDNPKRHVDVGSRLDGFVAHVASFRDIEVLDIRNVTSQVPGIKFTQADLMQDSAVRSDSVSCLHAIEHFGLGRYGDEVDPQGHLKGFSSIASIVTKGGVLYLSFPISKVERTEVNAHRVFDPRSVFSWPGIEGFKLEKFSFVDDAGDFFEDVQISDAESQQLVFGCGIYTLRKL